MKREGVTQTAQRPRRLVNTASDRKETRGAPLLRAKPRYQCVFGIKSKFFEAFYIPSLNSAQNCYRMGMATHAMSGQGRRDRS